MVVKPGQTMTSIKLTRRSVCWYSQQTISMAHSSKNHWAGAEQAKKSVHPHCSKKFFSVKRTSLKRCHSDPESNLNQGARKLTGENLKLVRAEFSTISQAVLKMCMKLMYVDARPHLQLKTRPGFILLAKVKFVHVSTFFSLKIYPTKRQTEMFPQVQNKQNAKS